MSAKILNELRTCIRQIICELIEPARVVTLFEKVRKAPFTVDDIVELLELTIYAGVDDPTMDYIEPKQVGQCWLWVSLLLQSDNNPNGTSREVSLLHREAKKLADERKQWNDSSDLDALEQTEVKIADFLQSPKVEQYASAIVKSYNADYVKHLAGEKNVSAEEKAKRERQAKIRADQIALDKRNMDIARRREQQRD